ncbi:ExeA family protein [Kangiella aquimarina]|uniref:AAA family ATPase n=1 Tax=Kangiella aquimarina TaxID=261965 RepID=A0ABZ0X633_9GAMM|nr:AAA family ATPase [Kangiella aquimarina]WQG86078.1 AAA family ATPase [Kangiella aquimarina]
MYNDFFGLKETPFTIAPDPRYLFMSERHRDALAHLLYGIGAGGGFVLLTGEVGTGKTTVCRCLLEQLPANVRLAYILNPKLNAIELMATMCDELGIEYDPRESSLKTFTDLLSRRLLDNHEQGLNTVLMIDEAQNLSVEVLEQIRLLTNLETNQKKLLQIILIGQPELQELLAKKELRQLAQRITARYHLRPLSLNETKSYLEHRLRIAGVMRPVFKGKAIKLIHKASGGIPRLINVISDRAMLGAFAENLHHVDVRTVNKAVSEVLGEKTDMAENGSLVNHWKWAVPTLLVGLTLGVTAWSFGLFNDAVGTSSEQQPEHIAQLADSSQAASINEQTTKVGETDESSIKTNDVAGENVRENISKTPSELAEEFWGEQSWDRSGAIASQNLLALWGVSYLPFQSPDACSFAANYGLGCDQGMTDWKFLSQLNRPANLKFTTAQGGDFWGTLIEIQDQSVVMQFGENQVMIERKKINPMWTGEYRLFWKKPAGFRDPVGIGSRGAEIIWLTNFIEMSEGITIEPDNVFSEQVADWLALFQMEHGLISDGILGKHSIMMINNLAEPSIPKLFVERLQVEK